MGILHIHHKLRPAAWMAIIASVLFAVLTITVVTGATLSFDTAVLTALHSNASFFLDAVVPKLTYAGEALLVGVAALMVTAGLLYSRRFASAAVVFCGVMGAAGLNYLIKNIVERARPELWERLVSETSYSFPSGHATASAALALSIVAILWHTKWRRHSIVVATVYILLVAFTRLYLGVHYPSDIIAGWLTSAAWVGVVVLLAMRPVRSIEPTEKLDN